MSDTDLTVKRSKLTIVWAIAFVLFLAGTGYALFQLLKGGSSFDAISEKSEPSNSAPQAVIEPWTRPWREAIEPKFAVEMIRRQVEFGPRIPGSPAHLATKEWIIAKLKEIGGNAVQVDVQAFDAPIGALLGKPARASFNIWARFFPERKRRVVFAAHWDTREHADKDSKFSDGLVASPADGAIDGASGVAAAFEMARALIRTAGHEGQVVGWDVLLFDAEDQGLSGNEPGLSLDADLLGSWCLGSQYWLVSPWRAALKAEFGVLFDMVGAEGSKFPQEAHSLLYAKPWVDLIWAKAQALRYGDFFIDERAPAITDDHVFVNRGGIPMVDIIDLRPDTGRARGGDWFGPYHHRLKDSVGVIDPLVLQAVTETTISVVEDWSK